MSENNKVLQIKKFTEIECQQIFQKADQEGKNAVNQAVENKEIVGMVVSHHMNQLDDSSPVLKQWYVGDGICGFAWVEIRPANSRFARYLTNNGLAYKSSYGGIHMSVRDYGQSLQKKEKYARAFATVLRDYGINAYAESRID